MGLCDINLCISSSQHPQTDGSSDIVNRMVENYLRCFCNHSQRDWETLLPTAEFAYNSAKVQHLGMCPFELDFGWIPRSPLY